MTLAKEQPRAEGPRVLKPRPRVAERRQRLRTAVRYGLNLASSVARQEGALRGTMAAVGFVITEAARLPRLARRAVSTRSSGIHGRHPLTYSQQILDDLIATGVPMLEHTIDVQGFRDHVALVKYPAYYAGGSMDTGGVREQKLLEYYVSLEITPVTGDDVALDIASEWSAFPDMLRSQSGAQVYRQDLVYPPGFQGNRIGGSADAMPVPDGFATRMFLHNSFEHFEGDADTGFVPEAWRILRPGGTVCILPLFMAERHTVLTDPLADRRGMKVDEGAEVAELPWWRNRFGRFYDAGSLMRRVVKPARQAGFDMALYHVLNDFDVHPRTFLHFALVLTKPLPVPRA